MRRAEREKRVSDRADSAERDASALSDDAVLGFLETDLSADEDRRRIRGIVNGLALGALIWLVLISALVVAT